MPHPLTTLPQASAYASPWGWRVQIGRMLWSLVWTSLCGWTPSAFNRWRLLCLRGFGARISGRPYVHARARITYPWNLALHHRACLGDRAHAYNLAEIELREGCTVAQEAYLCTGTHDWDSPDRPLQVAKITIGAGALIGARAFILPGRIIGADARVGAGAIVTRDVEPGATVAGNPARPINSARPPRKKV